MINGNPKRRWFFLFAVVTLVTITVISAGVFSAKKQQPKIQDRKDWLRSTPPVSSKVKDLEIINQRIVRPNTVMPGVAFAILNNSSRAVMAVEVACGEASISQDGLEDEERPTVIIEPYGTLTAEMNGELTPGNPIVITAAIFDDGKEDGDKTSLTFMHKIRARQRAQLKAKKEAAVLGGSPNQ
jgi:hypothetical protein